METNKSNENINKNFSECILQEVKDKPLTVLIAVMTFLSGILFSMIKLCSYIEEMQFANVFHISNLLIKSDLSRTTIILLVSFVLVALSSMMWLLAYLYYKRQATVTLLYIFLCIAYSFFGLVIARNLTRDPFIQSTFVLILFIILAFAHFAILIFSLISSAKKKREETRINEQNTHHNKSYHTILWVIGIGLFIVMGFLISSVVKSDTDDYLRQLDGSVVINGDKMYAIIYKTDDYIIGEAIEEKETDGIIYYEIDTAQQKLFDSFGFEMKYLENNDHFELKNSSLTNPNVTTQNTTVLITSEPITTATSTTAANTTDYNP